VIPLKDNLGAGGFPAVTVALIALCSLVFLWQLTLSGERGSAGERNGDVVAGEFSERDEFAETYGVTPAQFAENVADDEFDEVPWWTAPFTAIPVAADFLHLVVNMLFLLIFGRTLEARLGRLRLGAIAIAGTLAAIGVQALAEPESQLLAIGAASMLAGLLGAYAVLHPRAGVVTLSVIPGFGTVLEVPALLTIAVWFAIGLIPAVGPMVDGDLLIGTGLEYAGYGAALLAGGLAGLALGRGRAGAEAEWASA
jgi:membrane associated rhomboid family serine protease